LLFFILSTRHKLSSVSVLVSVFVLAKILFLVLVVVVLIIVLVVVPGEVLETKSQSVCEKDLDEAILRLTN
jgi:hypothetical protein